MARKRPDRRAIRRQEAEARQAAWDALSTEEKLAVLAGRPGECRRQIARLVA